MDREEPHGAPAGTPWPQRRDPGPSRLWQPNRETRSPQRVRRPETRGGTGRNRGDPEDSSGADRLQPARTLGDPRAGDARPGELAGTLGLDHRGDSRSPPAGGDRRTGGRSPRRSVGINRRTARVGAAGADLPDRAGVLPPGAGRDAVLRRGRQIGRLGHLRRQCDLRRLPDARLPDDAAGPDRRRVTAAGAHVLPVRPRPAEHVAREVRAADPQARSHDEDRVRHRRQVRAADR